MLQAYIFKPETHQKWYYKDGLRKTQDFQLSTVVAYNEFITKVGCS